MINNPLIMPPPHILMAGNLILCNLNLAQKSLDD